MVGRAARGPVRALPTSRAKLVVAFTLALLLLTSAASSALTIRGNFMGGQPAGPTFGGGSIVEIFRAAAAMWEHAIRDDFTVTFDFGWGSPAPGVYGSSHQLLAQGGTPNRETHGLLLFNNPVGGAGPPDFVPLFLDPTPHGHEEFPIVSESTAQLAVNVERRLIAPFDGPLGIFTDFFSVVLHEIGHGLGLSMANSSFRAEALNQNITITSPLPFAGAVVPLDGSHVDLPHGPLMGTNGLSFNTRSLPSDLDILVNAQVSGFRELRLAAADAPTFPDPSEVGQWSAPFTMPLGALHAVLLRNGRVLMWDDRAPGGVYVWDPATGTFAGAPSPGPMFGAAQALLADGDVLVLGGHDHVQGGLGIPDVSRFDPMTNAWSVAAPMTFARFSPTATTLPDGRVLVVSGSTDGYGDIVATPEVYDPATNLWTMLAGARLSMPLYPHMFVLPDGRVLYAGASEATVETWALDPGAQTWTMIDPFAVAGGSSVMYRPGKVVKAGSPGAAAWMAPADAVNTAYVLDMDASIPAWQRVGDMKFGRASHALTLLPDGNVLAAGGVARTDDPNSTPVLAAEIWDAKTQTWSTMASGQKPRAYYKTSLLLPDGRVLVAGNGGIAGMQEPFDGELFSPPYLFNGPRPEVTSVPGTVAYGSRFSIQTPDRDAIASVALIGLLSVTHGFDSNQRYVPLSFARTLGGLEVEAPADGNLAPAGHYMLFIVNRGGVPSVARFVRIEPDAVP
jgi:hypothetical protein